MLKVFDSALQAYTECPPKNHDTALNAWVDSPSAKTFDAEQNAWVEQLASYIDSIQSSGFNPPTEGTVTILKNSVSLNLKKISSWKEQAVDIFFNPKEGDHITFDFVTDQGSAVTFNSVAGSRTLWIPPSGVGSAYNSSGELKIAPDVNLSGGIRIRLSRVNIGLSTFPEINISLSNLKINGRPCYFTKN